MQENISKKVKTMKYTYVIGVACMLILAQCSNLKKGDKRFQQGNYDYAIGYYMKALEKEPNSPIINLKIAESYRLSNRLPQALTYYKAAIDNKTTESSALFYYALILKSQEKYEEAANQMQRYIKMGNNPDLLQRAKREVKNLKDVPAIRAKKVYYEVKPFDFLNTASSEYAPVIRENTLVFSSTRTGKVYGATGGGYSDIFEWEITNKDSQDPNQIKPISTRVNDGNVNEGCATFSRDGKMMVFGRGNTGKPRGAKDVDLYFSRYRDGGWASPDILSVNDPDAWDSSPAFSKDGNTLYFASDRKGGYGGVDLYKATQDKNGKWGNVTNLGGMINTPGDEMFPYVSDEGKLYFASSGHPGLGGLDIFVSTKQGKETKVENIGMPINSSYDDFGICFKNTVDGYFTSNRPGGKGEDDIYYFFDVTPNTKIVNYTLAITTKTMDNNQEIVLDGVKVRVSDSKGKLLKEISTGSDGKLSLPVETGRNYVIIGEKKDYFTKRDEYSMVGRSIPLEDLVKPVTDTTLQTVLWMEKIAVNKIVVLNNIYYDLDKYDIRKDAAEELDNLVKFLKDNPTVKIELSSHTDVRGSDEYNMKLSQKRAESAVNYIISKGVSADRLVAKGYGETKLIIQDAQAEEEHQVNRRTEFKVLEK